MTHRGTPTPRTRWIRAVRIVLPALLVVLWVAGASVGGPLFGRIDEVSSNDRTAYLPTSAEATQVQKAAEAFTEGDTIPAIVVVTADGAGDGALSEDQLRGVQDALASAEDLDQVSGDVSPPIPSEDGRAVESFVPLDAGADLGAAVSDLESSLAEDLPAGTTSYVTGPAGFSGDLTEAFSGIDGLLLGVALAAVLAILLIVYRSALLPFMVLATSMFALCAALAVIWHLAHAGVLLLSGQTQGILFILVIGAATDYSLLMVARYREELRAVPDRGVALLRAIRGTAEPILASGGTVIAALLCLLLSDLRSNSTLGPVAAIGIAFAMLSALTLLPALLFLAGRTAFWPRRPLYDPAEAERSEEQLVTRGLWAGVARRVERHPRRIWIGVVLVLCVACAGLLQLRADGVSQSELVLGDSQARTGQEVLGEHFPGGSGSPAQILVPQDQLQETADRLLDADGVESVSARSSDAPSGSAAVTADGIRGGADPRVEDGRVLLEATLADAPDSAAAEDTVRGLREDLPQDALVGGETATAIDTDDASVHDRNLIIPVVLAVIAAILVLLLRSLLAPLLLIATTALSFGAALGVSALVFDHVLDFPGADAAVPLYGFVFLVALGIDYNIFLMTRVREESLAHGTRPGILRGLTLTGGVITSAGIVLAATFAALAVIPILFLAQLAFIVAFGVLLDTFVVRTLLVPALAVDVGRSVWWPSRLARRADRAD
ncbi:MMPL family transporter [Brachybacterium sp. MASK1Z-5]|uniref:MMPL family transporter n=1 Tax=Brachybacterium halotolerans TaxID=2795215 RepID=A0ABS1BEK8_9MICO|nr:MMPL family transporter [Brachybacterium halotolerans]MBK0333081.1 MMPL family transporter [Brachybacterium halotolerans]